MSTFPLDETYVAALRWACEYTIASPEEAAAWRPVDESRFPQAHALEALSSPASAASLVRDLLARAGVDDVALCANPGDVAITSAHWALLPVPAGIEVWDGQGLMRMVHVEHAPRLISALVSLAPGDREGAMRALREVGR